MVKIEIRRSVERARELFEDIRQHFLSSIYLASIRSHLRWHLRWHLNRLEDSGVRNVAETRCLHNLCAQCPQTMGRMPGVCQAQRDFIIAVMMQL